MRRNGLIWPLVLIVIIGGVLVGGFAYLQLKPRIITQTHQASIDDIANWKTYTNKKIGYKIKYPEDAIVKGEETKQNVHLLIIDSPDWEKTQGRGGYQLQFIVESGVSDEFFLDFRKSISDEHKKGGSEVVSEKTITIDSKDGIYMNIKSPSGSFLPVEDVIYLPFPKKKTILQISWIFGFDEEKNSAVVEKIYSSLRF